MAGQWANSQSFSWLELVSVLQIYKQPARVLIQHQWSSRFVRLFSLMLLRIIVQQIRRLSFTELLLLLEEITLELQFRHDLRNQGIAYQVGGLTDDSEASSSDDEDLWRNWYGAQSRFRRWLLSLFTRRGFQLWVIADFERREWQCNFVVFS